MTISKSLISIVTVISIVGSVGCQNAPSDPTTEVTSPSAEFSDEDMFRGLVLAQGPVAQEIPEIAEQLATLDQLSPQQRRVTEDLLDRLTEEVRDIDPDFFEYFAAEVRSGDHIRVMEALTDASGMVNRAMTQIEELQAARTAGLQAAAPEELVLDSGDSSTAAPPLPPNIILAAVPVPNINWVNPPTQWADSGIAVVTVVAAVAVVFGLVAVYIDVFGPSSAGQHPGGPLLRDQIVDSVTQRFGA
ncbi:MAG: hypothetical protein AAF799_47060 [Myxococcota bacterium]